MSLSLIQLVEPPILRRWGYYRDIQRGMAGVFSLATIGQHASFQSIVGLAWRGKPRLGIND